MQLRAATACQLNHVPGGCPSLTECAPVDPLDGSRLGVETTSDAAACAPPRTTKLCCAEPPAQYLQPEGKLLGGTAVSKQQSLVCSHHGPLDDPLAQGCAKNGRQKINGENPLAEVMAGGRLPLHFWRLKLSGSLCLLSVQTQLVLEGDSKPQALKASWSLSQFSSSKVPHHYK